MRNKKKKNGNKYTRTNTPNIYNKTPYLFLYISGVRNNVSNNETNLFILTNVHIWTNE